MKITNSTAFGTFGSDNGDRRFTLLGEGGEITHSEDLRNANVNKIFGKYGSDYQRNGGDMPADEFAAMVREMIDGPAKVPRFKTLAVAIALCYPNVPKEIW